MSPQTISLAAADDLLLTERDLLPFFRIKSLRTIRRWIARGELPPHVRIGSRRYWRRSTILAHLAEHESPTGRVSPKRSRRARRAAE